VVAACACVACLPGGGGTTGVPRPSDTTGGETDASSDSGSGGSGSGGHAGDVGSGGVGAGTGADPTPIDVTVSGDFHPASYSRLVFSDEFDGDSLDRSKWCTRYQWGGGAANGFPVQPEFVDPVCQQDGNGDLFRLNNEQAVFTDRNQLGELLHVVSDGTLKLRATKTLTDAEWNWLLYESAMIRTRTQMFAPTADHPLYLTARVKLPGVKGTFPAFWVAAYYDAARRFAWPPEIDFFEAPLNGGEDKETMLHHAVVVKGKQTDSGAREITYSGPGFDGGFGNYTTAASQRDRWIEVGAEWTAEQVCYYVDGLKVACENYRWVTNDGVSAASATLILNLSIGGEWAGRYDIDADRFPIAEEVDHVRVYSTQ